MSEPNHKPQMLLEIYRLHAELAEQAAAGRENQNKLYSGMVASIMAASVLLHRVAPDSETMWVLPVLGMVVSVSWMMSLRSMTARLAAKHIVLVELETSLPFEFLKRENEEFDRTQGPRRKWSAMVMPSVFIILCIAWLGTLL